VAQKEVHIRISAADQASGQFKKLQATVTQTTSAMQDLRSAMSRALSVTAGLGGFYAIKGLLVDSTKEAFRFSAALEQTAVGFKAMTGSATVAKTVMNELRTMSLKIPIELETAQDAARRLLAYGFQAGEVVPILNTIADAAAGLGLSMQDGGMRIALALGQIKSKGTLQSQEMRQLGEAGVAAWQMLANYLNTTVSDAMDRVQKRQIDSQTALTAILAGMNAKFAGQMEAQASTFNGRLMVMTSTFKQAMVQAVVPVFAMLRDELFPSVTEKLGVFVRVAQSSNLSTAFDSFTRSIKGLNEALTVGKVVLEAYIARMTFMAVTTIGTTAVKAMTALRVAVTGVTAATVAMNTTFAGTSIATFSSAAASGAGMVGKLKMAVNALNVAVLALGKNLIWIIPYLAYLTSQKVFGYSFGQAESLSERRGMGDKPAMPPKSGESYGDALSKEQAALKETSRQEYLDQDRLFIEQAQANQKTMAELMNKPAGTSSGSGSDKYSKFVQQIKEQARELKLAYEVGRISIEEYTEALDKLAATKGLKDVHSLDIIKQKWEALEPIWKRYQESIDKAEDDRLKSYEKGKELIIQWNATEIELERLKAAAKLDLEEEYDNASLEAGTLTKEKVIENAIDRENRLYEIEMKALRDRLALGGLDVAGRDAINRQIEELQVSHNLRMVQLEIQLQQQKKTAMSVAQQAYATTNESINEQLVSLPTSLADAFAQAAVGYGSLSDSLKNLAQQLGAAIIKAMLLKVIMGWMGGGGMFGGTSMSGVMGVLHEGGIVGLEGSRRFVSGLPKFHSGGLSGDEQIAVLKKGEGVFTKEQMRAMGGMGGDQTIVNMTVHAIDAKGVRDFFTTNRGYVEGIVVQSVKRSGAVRSAIRGS